MIQESTNTGFAPCLTTGRIQDIIVNDGNIISSFFLSLRESYAICKAAVPFETEMAYFLFKNFANFFSNSTTNFPEEEINPEKIRFIGSDDSVKEFPNTLK